METKCKEAVEQYDQGSTKSIWKLARGALRRRHANKKSKQPTPIILDGDGRPTATQAQLSDMRLPKFFADFANRGEIMLWEGYLQLYDDVCDDMPVTAASCVNRAFWMEEINKV